MPEIILCVAKEDHEYFGGVKCVCGAIEERAEFDDYASHPMVWCTTCGGRFFVDCESYDEKESKPIIDYSRYEVVGPTQDIFPNLEDPDEYICYKMPLCLVKKVAGVNMVKYESKTPLSQELLAKLSRIGVFDLHRNLQEHTLNKIYDAMVSNSIKIYADKFHKEYKTISKYKIPRKSKNDYKYVENIMVNCNSYNAQHVPNWVDMEHGRGIIYCIIDHRGKDHLVAYWSD